jgi:thioredoxin-dependent peroxiredoxin
MTVELKAGDPAPDFDLPADGGGRVRLADFKGKTLVVYFYPKDDTTGCTNEAKGFTEAAGDFAKAGVAVVGISKDSVARHDRFKAKYGLNFPLGSDVDGVMVEAYGVWVEKVLYGRKYMGIDRSTFLIGADGKVVRVWRKVKVPGHVAQVLAAAQAL